jgi:prophage DNA circulation protein
MQELYPAQLDGIALEIETFDDTFEKAIAKHEFPNRDGALLEDMGQKARTVNIRCYFWDHGDHQTYADHVKLVNHLGSQALSELVHPVYGSMQGMVERVTVRHDDREMMAEVDISFVENLRDTIEDVEYEDVEAATEEAFIAGQDEQQIEAAADLAGALDVANYLDPALTILAQIKGATAAARELAREMDGYINLAKGMANEVTQTVDSVVAVVNYSVNLPGRVVGIVARVVESVAQGYQSIKSYPSRYMNSLGLAFQNLINKFEMFSDSHSQQGEKARAFFVKHLRIACGQRMALEAAYVYNADERKRQQVRRTEQAKSFDVNGRYYGAAATEPVLNVRELEESLAATRELLQEAFDQARGMQSLKVMARSLLEHVNTVKLERDRIITIVLDNPMPLHLVCLKYGLPYNMSDRLLSINKSIRNPSFTAGEVQIYVR